MAAKSFEKLIEEIGSMYGIGIGRICKSVRREIWCFCFNANNGSGAGSSSGSAAAAAEEKSSYKVTLKDGGPDKIKTIKALKQVTQLSLGDAKKAVEEAPTVIAESASKDDAKKMKEALKQLGLKLSFHKSRALCILFGGLIIE